MSARIRILLALLGCLVIGTNALASAHAHCDPLCCDEPCESGPLAPEPDCACCAVRGDLNVDPLLPALSAPAPAPALLPLPVLLPAAPAIATPAISCPAPIAPPSAARSSILRL